MNRLGVHLEQARQAAYEQYVDDIVIEARMILLVEFERAVSKSAEFRGSVITPYMREVITRPDQTEAMRVPGRNKIRNVRLLKPSVYGSMSDIVGAQKAAYQAKSESKPKRNKYWEFFVWDRGIGKDEILSKRVLEWSRYNDVAPTLGILAGRAGFKQRPPAYPMGFTYDFEKAAQGKLFGMLDRHWSLYELRDALMSKEALTLNTVTGRGPEFIKPAALTRELLKLGTHIVKVIPQYMQYSGKGRQMYFGSKTGANSVLTGYHLVDSSGKRTWIRAGSGYNMNQAMDAAYSFNEEDIRKLQSLFD